MIHKMKSEPESPLSSLWSNAIVTGIAISMTIVFGGTYLNAGQILNADQETYSKIVSVIMLAGFKGEEIRSMVK